MSITDETGKIISPNEFLQRQFPLLFLVHKLQLDGMVGGGNEKKLALLLDTLQKYNESKATGSIIIDYSKGRIANIDTKVRITSGTADNS